MIPNELGMYPQRSVLSIDVNTKLTEDHAAILGSLLMRTKLMNPVLVINPVLRIQLEPINNNCDITAMIYLNRIKALFNNRVTSFEIYDIIDGYIPIKLHVTAAFRTIKYTFKGVDTEFSAYITATNRANADKYPKQ